MLVIVAPGQGSQTPGFLAPWLEVPGVAARLDWLSAVAGLDLTRHGTVSDAETLRNTAVAQPLIVAGGMVSLLSLFPHPSDAYGVIGAGAGHSVGEITAAAAAGVITAEQAMVLVRERGFAMARAVESADVPTGMSAVIGGDPDEVRAAIAGHGLSAANVNAAGQVVAAGPLAALATLAAAPPARTRVVPLQVAGAFHTDYMAPAADLLATYTPAITTHDPRVRLVSNADGHVVHDGREVLRRIVDQTRRPVRWDLCLETFKDLGVTGLIEIPPAGTLSNLAKRALPGVEILALKTPDDLDAAQTMIARHGSPGPLVGSPSWRIVVAPSKGMVHRVDLTEGDPVTAGAHVATVRGRHADKDVHAMHDGTVVEWLVEEGDPVAPGQPLVRLMPAVPADGQFAAAQQ
ncbi:acyltransferase domain-containing protein [Spongisporangium articulatum]|uniref:[acyl-carrier-protein] S-malonyltransferase n=1 Tax=Spongisporangium articulatum TaxID=3362603 RepID=A0ABW8ALN9_9ACTN